MNKITKLLLLSLLSLSLVGCGKEKSEAPAETVEEETYTSRFNSLTFPNTELHVSIGDKEEVLTADDTKDFMVEEVTPTPAPNEIFNETSINIVFPSDISNEYKNQVHSIINELPEVLTKGIKTIKITPEVRNIYGSNVNGFYLLTNLGGLKEIHIYNRLEENELKETIYHEAVHALDMEEVISKYSSSSEFQEILAAEWITEENPNVSSYETFADVFTLYCLGYSSNLPDKTINDYPMTKEYLKQFLVIEDPVEQEIETVESSEESTEDSTEEIIEESTTEGSSEEIILIK